MSWRRCWADNGPSRSRITPMNLKERARQLRTDIPALFIALRKKETPAAAKFFAGLAVAYALSPIDLIPDFIPVLGYLDDIILLPALVALTIKFIPDEVFERCRKEAEGLWADGKPKKMVLRPAHSHILDAGHICPDQPPLKKCVALKRLIAVYQAIVMTVPSFPSKASTAL